MGELASLLIENTNVDTSFALMQVSEKLSLGVEQDIEIKALAMEEMESKTGIERADS